MLVKNFIKSNFKFIQFLFVKLVFYILIKINYNFYNYIKIFLIKVNIII